MTGVARGDWYRARRTPVNFSGSQLANNKAISGEDAGAYLYRIPGQTLLLLSVNTSKLNTPIRDYSHLHIDIFIPIISIVLRLYFSTEIKINWYRMERQTFTFVLFSWRQLEIFLWFHSLTVLEIDQKY